MKCFKVACLKLHNLRGWKRRAVDQALRAYTDGYREILVACEPIAPALIQSATRTYTTKTVKTRQSVSQFDMAAGVRGLGIKVPELSALAEDSVYSHVAASLISHHELKNLYADEEKRPADMEEPNFPVGRETEPEDKYLWALEELQYRIMSNEEEQERKWELERNTEYKPTPLLFSRGGRLAFVEHKPGEWGLTLNLLSAKEYAPRHTARVPVEVTSWHRKEFFEKGTPRTAALVLREGEYYLHITFEFVVDDVETANVIGVNRGVYKPGCWAVVNPRGEVLQTGYRGRAVRRLQNDRGKRVQEKQQRGKRVSWRDYGQHRIDTYLHLLANDIVENALLFKAKVVVDDFDPKLKYEMKWTRSMFAKFLFILDYKCRAAGLPKPQPIFCANVSRICCVCGEDGRKEKESFVGECGHRHDVDCNAAILIARNSLYRKKAWERKGGYRAFHYSFAKLKIRPLYLV